MGQINVKGLGVVNIEGETPTVEESQKIKEAISSLNFDRGTDKLAEEAQMNI